MAIIINCFVNTKKKYLDCFANEKTETIGKGRRKVIRFLCSLRGKKNIYVYINVSGTWEVQGALATITKILGLVWFQIKIFNTLYSKVFQWPV